jgi:hypothetical protein
MKSRWLMVACMTVLLGFAGNIVLAQDRAPRRNDQRLSPNRKYHNRIKFDDHDRQVVRDWYNPARDNILVGMRDPKRAASYEDSRLQMGSAHDADLPIRHSALIKFWDRLTSSPRSYQYVAIQGHVEAIDDNYQDINDLIHFKLYF